MIIEVRNYRIAPYSGNTCWKIQKKQEKEDAKVEWCDPYYYPSTLDRAIEIVAEQLLRESKRSAKSIKEAVDEMGKITKEFEEVLSRLKIVYPGDEVK